MLHHAVEMLLDADAEKAVRSVWERLQAAGLSSTMLALHAHFHARFHAHDAAAWPC